MLNRIKVTAFSVFNKLSLIFRECTGDMKAILGTLQCLSTVIPISAGD